MKKIRNIVPLPLGGKVIEPGTVFEHNIDIECYQVTRHPFVVRVNETQAADRRLFEPVEERFIRNGEPCRVITATGEVFDLYFWDTCPGDAQRFAFGNVFRVDTNLNAHGVHLDDALKVFRLALRVPKLWKYLQWRLDSECFGSDNPLSFEEMETVDKAIQEIKTAAKPQKGREA